MPKPSTTLALAAITATVAVSSACSSGGEDPPALQSQTPVPYPVARGYAQLLFHGPTGRVILYGGESIRRRSLEETWAYDVQSNQWSDLTSDVHPVGVEGGTAAYDRESDRIIVHFTTRLDASADRGLVRLSETWALDPTSGRWTDMRPDPAPFGLMGARMAYDVAADRMILFGGADFTLESEPRFDGTWTYDFNTNTWTERQPARRPPGRSYFGMAYDEQARKTLVFGGRLAAEGEDRSDELWAYDYPSNTWERIEYEGDVRADHHPSMVYASAQNKTFYLVRDGFWAFDYPSRSWTALAFDDALGIRHFHSMAFDETAQRLVLFGGGPRGLMYDNETWMYDPASNGWERRGPMQQSLVSRIRGALSRGGLEEAVAIHRAYREENPRGTDADTEAMMNHFGYILLGEYRVDHAVAVFRMNAEDHPESPNAFDSLGDGLLATGDTTGAIEAWREALRLDPSFTASADNLRRVGFDP